MAACRRRNTAAAVAAPAELHSNTRCSTALACSTSLALPVLRSCRPPLHPASLPLQLGTHKRGKAKREEMAGLLRKMAAKAHK